MQLVNLTPYPAALFRGVLDEERLCASVAARVTFDLNGAGTDPVVEQAWPVEPGPWDSPYGTMAGDELFYRGGVDLFVFGSACAPGGAPARSVDVVLEVDGRVHYRIVVFGERRWERRGGSLVPSEPLPFTTLPLTLAHAFGGQDEWDALPVPYPDNPHGLGYYVDEAHAEGGALPRIEDPANPVRTWDDRPEPAGMGLPPPFFGPRLRRSVDVDERTGRITRFDGLFFNAAFPAMVLPRQQLGPGTRLRLWGVQPSGPLDVNVPVSGLQVRLAFGDQVTDVAMPIDQVGIEVEQRRLFISYRYPFRYRLIPHQLRSCTLLQAAGGGAG
jgi:hypothetical protein